MSFRVGFGFDVHQLLEGEEFWLGGILIPHTKGAVGHSDADVLIHTICDALLGAANLRDIGFHFPDTDVKFKAIDSKLLLKQVMDLLAKEGFKLGNIDATIALQKPKISTLIPQMQQTLAKVMNVVPSKISIKATTTEKLGFVGREEGVSCYAVVMLKKVS